MGEAILFFLIFLCTTIFFVLVGMFFVKIKRLNNIDLRVKTFIPESINENETKDFEIKDFKTPSFIATIGKNFKGLPFNEKLKKQLLEAGLSLKSEDFYVIRIAAAVILFLITFLLGINLFVCLIALPIGYWLPIYGVNYLRKRRLTRCVNQLAETLGIMANSLRAGFSFMQVMQMIGREMPDPIGPEFDRTVQEVSYGIPLERAFENMIKRLPDKNLEMVLSALIIQRKSGGNLAELIETMQETVRGRVRIKEEIQTLTAEGRISGIIITLLPIALGGYLYFSNPEYFGILIEEPLGWILLGFGSLSIFIGWLVIRKMVQIEV